MTSPCPACGFLVFDEPPGSFAICQVCGWEDDHVQLAHPLMRGGANHESLVEAQQAALAKHAIDVREVVVGGARIDRDPEWRPIRQEEAAVRTAGPRDGLEYFEAAAGDSPPYYWRKS